jgi:RNA polymerase primary sigma factor
VAPIDGSRKQGDNGFSSSEEAQRLFEELLDVELDEILDPREQKILRLKWGLEDGREYNNREIGLEFRLGDERVRQISTRAVHKLVKRLADGRGADDG